MCCLPYSDCHMIWKVCVRRKHHIPTCFYAVVKTDNCTIAMNLTYPSIAVLNKDVLKHIWEHPIFRKKKHLMPTGKVALFIVGCKTRKSTHFVFHTHREKSIFSLSVHTSTHSGRLMYYSMKMLYIDMECLRAQHNDTRPNKTMMNKYSKPVANRIFKSAHEQNSSTNSMVSLDTKWMRTGDCRHVDTC